MNNNIKTLTAHTCPFCSEQILIEFEFAPPVVNSVITEEHIKAAKEDVLKALADMDISEEEKKQAEEWVMKDDTVFSPSDVDTIINDIKNSS